jgi:hypothetical protein
MASSVDSFRGTLSNAVEMSRHLAWYVSWQTGGDAVRECSRPQASGAAASRQLAIRPTVSRASSRAIRASRRSRA